MSNVPDFFVHVGPVVGRPISANPGLNFNLGFIFFCSKAYSQIAKNLISLLFLEDSIMDQIVDRTD